MKVLICAGGTGGGIYPALAAATELQRLGVRPDEILWVGTTGEMEETLVPKAGLELATIEGGPIVSVPLHIRLRNAAKLARSVGTASRYIRDFKPNVTFVTGAYVAAPVGVASRRHGVPIVIYQPDVEPGMSVKRIMPLAQRVACTVDASRAYIPEQKMVVTGYPVRPELRAALNMSQEEALAKFNLTPDRPTLFVFGGSRGARNINRAIVDILPELLAEIQVIHISGTFTWDEVYATAQHLPEDLRVHYRPYPYLHDRMGAAYRAADLVVARAGASMLGECPAFSLPSILVPLAWAWRYQKVNADYLTDQGAAVQLTDESLSELLLPTIQSLIHNQDQLAGMSAAAHKLDKPEAATDLAKLILAVGNKIPNSTISARQGEQHD